MEGLRRVPSSMQLFSSMYLYTVDTNFSCTFAVTDWACVPEKFVSTVYKYMEENNC